MFSHIALDPSFFDQKLFFWDIWENGQSLSVFPVKSNRETIATVQKHCNPLKDTWPKYEDLPVLKLWGQSDMSSDFINHSTNYKSQLEIH